MILDTLLVIPLLILIICLIWFYIESLVTPKYEYKVLKIDLDNGFEIRYNGKSYYHYITDEVRYKRYIENVMSRHNRRK